MNAMKKIQSEGVDLALNNLIENQDINESEGNSFLETSTKSKSKSKITAKSKMTSEASTEWWWRRWSRRRRRRSNPRQGCVIVYSDCGYRGRKFTACSHTGIRNLKWKRMDRNISSVKVGRHATVNLYAGHNYKGRRVQLTRNTYCLASRYIRFNDKARSMYVGKPRPGCVIVYSDCGYRGRSLELCEHKGIRNLRWKRMDRNISSVKVGPNASVTLYKGHNYHGETKRLTRSTRCLWRRGRNWNDKARSMYVGKPPVNKKAAKLKAAKLKAAKLKAAKLKAAKEKAAKLKAAKLKAAKLKAAKEKAAKEKAAKLKAAKEKAAKEKAAREKAAKEKAAKEKAAREKAAKEKAAKEKAAREKKAEEERVAKCVVVFTACNYKGKKMELCGKNKGIKDLASKKFDKKISSIKVGKKSNVSLYSKIDYQGEQIYITKNIKCLHSGAVQFDNKAKSILVNEPKKVIKEAKDGCILFYEYCNFEGREMEFCGTKTYKSLGFLDKTRTSMIVGKHTNVKLYSSSNSNKKLFSLTNNHQCLLYNTKLQSTTMKVRNEPKDGCILVYEGCNFKGNQREICGTQEFKKLEDDFASIKAGKFTDFKLFSKENFQGPNFNLKDLGENTTCLSKAKSHDGKKYEKTLSMKLINEPKVHCVLIYQHCYYEGKIMEFCGTTAYRSLETFNNKNFSIKIGKYVNVSIFSNKNYEGSKFNLAKSNSCLHQGKTHNDDKHISMIVRNEPKKGCTILYEKCDYKGKQIEFCGIKDYKSLNYFDKKISSVKIGKNINVELYLQKDFKGEELYLDRNNRCLKRKFNNGLRSMRVIQEAKDNCIEVYEKCDYKGKHKEFCGTNYYKSLGSFQKIISSVKVGIYSKVNLYSELNKKGKKLKLTKNNRCFDKNFKNLAKSMTLKNEPEDGCIIVYDGCYYRGRQTEFCGTKSFITKETDTQFRSIKFGRHTNVNLYLALDYEGEKLHLSKNNRCIDKKYENAKSMIVKNEAKDGCILVFEDCNYRGKQKEFCSNNFKDLEWFDKKISSIKLGKNARVTIFSQKNFKGKNRLITGNRKCLTSQKWDDGTRSMKVSNEPRKGCVILYEHCNYRGRQRTEICGDTTKILAKQFDKQVSSIKVNMAEVKLYKTNDFKGNTKIFKTHQDCLDIRGWNNVARSIIVKDPRPNCVTIYEDCHFKGKEKTMCDYGDKKLSEEWINKISSIKIKGKSKIQIYRLDNFKGLSKTVTETIPCLAFSGWDDRVNSLKISKYNRPKPSPPIKRPKGKIGCVTIYQHCNFKGEKMQFCGERDINMNDLYKEFKKDIFSFSIWSKAEIILYEFNDFNNKDKLTWYDSSVSCLKLNWKVQSFQIRYPDGKASQRRKEKQDLVKKRLKASKEKKKKLVKIIKKEKEIMNLSVHNIKGKVKKSEEFLHSNKMEKLKLIKDADKKGRILGIDQFNKPEPAITPDEEEKNKKKSKKFGCPNNKIFGFKGICLGQADLGKRLTFKDTSNSTLKMVWNLIVNKVLGSFNLYKAGVASDYINNKREKAMEKKNEGKADKDKKKAKLVPKFSFPQGCIGDFTTDALVQTNGAIYGTCTEFPLPERHNLSSLALNIPYITCPKPVEIAFCYIGNTCGTWGVSFNGGALSCVASATTGIGATISLFIDVIQFIQVGFSRERIWKHTHRVPVYEDNQLTAKEFTLRSHLYIGIKFTIPEIGIPVWINNRLKDITHIVDLQAIGKIYIDYGGKNTNTAKSMDKELQTDNGDASEDRVNGIVTTAREVSFTITTQLTVMLWAWTNGILPNLELIDKMGVVGLISFGKDSYGNVGSSNLPAGLYFSIQVPDPLTIISALWNALLDLLGGILGFMDIEPPELPRMDGLKIDIVINSRTLGFRLYVGSMFNVRCVMIREDLGHDKNGNSKWSGLSCQVETKIFAIIAEHAEWVVKECDKLFDYAFLGAESLFGWKKGSGALMYKNIKKGVSDALKWLKNAGKEVKKAFVETGKKIAKGAIELANKVTKNIKNFAKTLTGKKLKKRFDAISQIGVVKHTLRMVKQVIKKEPFSTWSKFLGFYNDKH